MSKLIPEDQIAQIQNGLSSLNAAITAISNYTPTIDQIPDRGISGNKIDGGRITNFESVGIKDASTRLVVLVNNDGILTDSIDVETLVGDTKVTGDLTVNGQITAKKLYVDELQADIRNERTSPLQFLADDNNSIYDKGLQWVGNQHVRQLVMKENPDRIFSTESIDLADDKGLFIGESLVLSKTQLGSTVRESRLTSVGTLKNLRTSGSLTVDEFMFYDAASMRFGIGTESPNAQFSVASLKHEFTVDVDDTKINIGAWTASDLTFVTDDTARLTITSAGNIHLGSKGSNTTKVSVFGHLGVGVNNVDDDVSITTTGPVRFENKKFQVGSGTPTSGSYKLGDIVWNDNPQPTSFIGWVCVREGSPGVWKPFGQIGS